MFNTVQTGPRIKRMILAYLEADTMTHAIWGTVIGMTLIVIASLYLHQYRLARRPDRRWTGRR